MNEKIIFIMLQFNIRKIIIPRLAGNEIVKIMVLMHPESTSVR